MPNPLSREASVGMLFTEAFSMNRKYPLLERSGATSGLPDTGLVQWN